MFRVILFLVAVLSVMAPATAQRQKPDPAVVGRWREYAESQAGRDRQAAWEGLSEYILGSNDGLIHTSTRKGPDGKAGETGIANRPATLCNCGWEPGEATIIWLGTIDQVVALLEQICGPMDEECEACLHLDIQIGTIIHELMHATGTQGPISKAEGEKLAYICELEYWCNLMEDDPEYQVAGCKWCAGTLLKASVHAKVDMYCFLAGPGAEGSGSVSRN